MKRKIYLCLDNLKHSIKTIKMPSLTSLASLSWQVWVNLVLFRAHSQGFWVQWSVFQAFSQLCTLILSFSSLGQILLFLSYSTKFISCISPLKSEAKQDLNNLIFPHLSFVFTTFFSVEVSFARDRMYSEGSGRYLPQQTATGDS